MLLRWLVDRPQSSIEFLFARMREELRVFGDICAIKSSHLAYVKFRRPAGARSRFGSFRKDPDTGTEFAVQLERDPNLARTLGFAKRHGFQ